MFSSVIYLMKKVRNMQDIKVILILSVALLVVIVAYVGILELWNSVKLPESGLPQDRLPEDQLSQHNKTDINEPPAHNQSTEPQTKDLKDESESSMLKEQVAGEPQTKDLENGSSNGEIEEQPPKFPLVMTLDKDLYHSAEIMYIHLAFESLGSYNITTRIHGIESRGRERLMIENRESVKPGETLLKYRYRAPNCFGCSGISPGMYNVTADIIYDDEIVATVTKEIEIQQ